MQAVIRTPLSSYASTIHHQSIKPLIRATSKMWFAGGQSSKHVLYINPSGEGWMTKAKSIVSSVTAKLFFGFKVSKINNLNVT